MAVYKVLAEEIDGVDLVNPTEVQLSGINTTFTPTTTNTATNVQDAIVNSSKSLGRIFTTASTTLTSSSLTFAVDTALSTTPGAGRWAIWYNANVNTNGLTAEGEVEFFLNGVGIATSLRQAQVSIAGGGIGGLTALAISCPMVLIHEQLFAATDVLTVRYRCTTLGGLGTGSFTIGVRSLLMIQTSTI